MGRIKELCEASGKWHKRINTFDMCPTCLADPGSPVTETELMYHRRGNDGVIYWKNSPFNGITSAISLLKKNKS